MDEARFFESRNVGTMRWFCLFEAGILQRKFWNTVSSIFFGLIQTDTDWTRIGTNTSTHLVKVNLKKKAWFNSRKSEKDRKNKRPFREAVQFHHWHQELYYTVMLLLLACLIYTLLPGRWAIRVTAIISHKILIQIKRRMNSSKIFVEHETGTKNVKSIFEKLQYLYSPSC